MLRREIMVWAPSVVEHDSANQRDARPIIAKRTNDPHDEATRLVTWHSRAGMRSRTSAAKTFGSVRLKPSIAA
jgi:hypothetical protein